MLIPFYSLRSTLSTVTEANCRCLRFTKVTLVCNIHQKLALLQVVFLCVPKREKNDRQSREETDWTPTKTNFAKV